MGDWSPYPCPSPWSGDGVLAPLRALLWGRRQGGGVDETQCPITSMEGFDSRARGSLACDFEGEGGRGEISGRVWAKVRARVRARIRRKARVGSC